MPGPAVRPRILFTEGSSTSSRQALYGLGPRCRIDVLDPSPWCQSRFSRFVRRRYSCPVMAEDPLGYLQRLVQILRREKFDVLFPTHEQVYLLSRVQERLRSLVQLVVPAFDALCELYDKASFVRLLRKLDIPHPETWIVPPGGEPAGPGAFPCYVKLAYGTAGQTVWRVRNADELRAAVNQCRSSAAAGADEELLIQREAPGSHGSTGGVFAHGRLVAHWSSQSLRRGVGGAAMQKSTVDWAPAVEQLRRIGEHLQWHGPLGADVVRDEHSGEFLFLEACPRIGESLPAALAGVNACDLLVRMAQGESLPPAPQLAPGVRTHQTFLTLVSLALENASRREIFAECMNALRGRGAFAGSRDELTRLREDWMSFFPAAGVTLLMLARPGAARGLVRKTVAQYSLSAAGARRIRDLTDAEIDRCFA